MVADRIFSSLCHPERSEAESNFLRGEAPAPSKKQGEGKAHALLFLLRRDLPRNLALPSKGMLLSFGKQSVTVYRSLGSAIPRLGFAPLAQ